MTGAELDVSLAIGDRGLRSFVVAFVLTQLVEVPIYVAALRRARGASRESASAHTTASAPEDGGAAGPPSSMGARGAIAFGASLVTHPIVWFVMPGVAVRLYTVCASLLLGGRALGMMGRTLLYGALAEGFAVLAEALYLRAFGVRRALAWSVGANAASVVVGTLIVWGLDP